MQMRGHYVEGVAERSVDAQELGLCPICGSQSVMTLWTIVAALHVHSNFPIVACTCEHARICRVPCHGVNAAVLMALERLDHFAAGSMPKINPRI